MAEPPLSDQQTTYLNSLIDIYCSVEEEAVGYDVDGQNNTTISQSENNEDTIHSMEEYLLNQTPLNESINADGNKQYGIWSEVSGKMC